MPVDTDDTKDGVAAAKQAQRRRESCPGSCCSGFAGDCGTEEALSKYTYLSVKKYSNSPICLCKLNPVDLPFAVCLLKCPER